MRLESTYKLYMESMDDKSLEKILDIKKGDVTMTDTIIREKVYKEFGKCVEISNGVVDLIVTVDIGPRIIRFGFVGEENELCESSELSKQVWNGEWKIWGGHRLWHSPEGDPRSYVPDNSPVKWEKIENGIRVIQEVEPWVQTEKQMEITLDCCDSGVKIVHKLSNKNAWPIEVSAWALTVMATGGLEIVPQSQRDTGLLGNRLIALWPYTKMNDYRVYWGDKYITLKQDPNMKQAIKFGIPNEEGWAAYLNHGNLFVKKYTHQMDAKYPDYGVSYETYTTDFMLEMETLSPLTILNPEDTIVHQEVWKLVKEVEVPMNEKEIDEMVDKHIRNCECY